MHLRLLFLSSHYRKNVDFSWPALDQAEANFERIVEWKNKLQEKTEFTAAKPITSNELTRFNSAMDDDLNTPLALSVLYDLITETNKQIAENDLSAIEARQILGIFEKMNKVFGLKFPKKETEIPEEIKTIAEDRLMARNTKDFQKSDELRKEIEKMGYTIEDLGDSYKIRKK